KPVRLDEVANPHSLPIIKKESSKKRAESLLSKRHLTKVGKLRDKDTASDKEMPSIIGITAEEAQKRASDLKGEGKVEVPERGAYRLVPGRISDVLRDLGDE